MVTARGKGVMEMFRNFRAEMAREGLSGIQVATKIGMSDKAFRNKMLGSTEFTRSEMRKIKDLFPEEVTFEYLFDMDDPVIKTT